MRTDDCEHIGWIDNTITQSGAIRAIHGWIHAEVDAQWVVFEPSRGGIFKIVYTFPRTDVSVNDGSVKGFLAEVVYGDQNEFDSVRHAHIGGVSGQCLNCQLSWLGTIGLGTEVGNELASAIVK